MDSLITERGALERKGLTSADKNLSVPKVEEGERLRLTGEEAWRDALLEILARMLRVEGQVCLSAFPADTLWGCFFPAWLSSFGLTRRQGSGLDLLDSKQDFEGAELVWLPEELSLSRLEEWFTLVWDQWEESCCWQLVCAWKLDLHFLCTSKANPNDHFHPPLLLVCVCACFAWSSGRRWCQIMRGVALP